MVNGNGTLGFGEMLCRRYLIREQGKKLRKLEGHEDIAFCIVFSPHGNALISGSFDETVRYWSLMDGKEGKSLARIEKRYGF